MLDFFFSLVTGKVDSHVRLVAFRGVVIFLQGAVWMRMETLAWAAVEPSVGGLGASWYVLEIYLLVP